MRKYILTEMVFLCSRLLIAHASAQLFWLAPCATPAHSRTHYPRFVVTVVPWLRSREERTRPTRPWQETPHELEARLQQAADWANTWFDGRSLCMGVPKRLSAMVSETHGDRLPH